MSVLAIVEDDLTLRVPQFFCCNCGAAQDIRPFATHLTAGKFMVPRGASTLQLELPYCSGCANSSKRRPATSLKKLFIAGLLAASTGLMAMITPLGRPIGSLAFYVTAGVVTAMVFGYYSLQKPRGQQTSYHQPVRLDHVDRRSGRVHALTLSFTHSRYAQAFATANKEHIASGRLQVGGR